MAVDQLIHAYVIKEETYPEKTEIFSEGRKNEWVYVILGGHIKIRKKISKGFITLDTLKEGAIFGETAFLESSQGIRSVSAVTATGPVRLGLLDSQRLVEDYDMVDPRLKHLIKSLIKRLRAANEKICEMVANAK